MIANFLQHLNGTLLLWLIFGGGVITSVVSSLAKNWRLAQQSKHLAALKQDMIGRGMSVDEIERVVRASPKPAEPEDLPAVLLTKKLSEHEVPAPAMQDILAVFAAADVAQQVTLANSAATMLDNGADVEHVLVALRALSGRIQPAETATKEHRFTDDPSSFRR